MARRTPVTLLSAAAATPVIAPPGGQGHAERVHGRVRRCLAAAARGGEPSPGLFGWQETGFRTPVAVAVLTEVGATILLAIALTAQATRRPGSRRGVSKALPRKRS
jgi:hypothetical protein